MADASRGLTDEEMGVASDAGNEIDPIATEVAAQQKLMDEQGLVWVGPELRYGPFDQTKPQILASLGLLASLLVVGALALWVIRWKRLLVSGWSRLAVVAWVGWGWWRFVRIDDAGGWFDLAWGLELVIEGMVSPVVVVVVSRWVIRGFTADRR